MKKLLLAFLLWASPSWATMTLVQHVVTSGCSGVTCTLTPASTGTGHVLLVGLVAAGPSRTISSLSAACGAWAHGPSQAGSDTTGASSDIQYCLSSTSGVTSITVTMAGGGINPWIVELVEYSFTGVSVAIDTTNNIDNTVNTNRGGVDLTALTGSNDLLYQVIALVQSTAVTAISGSYTSVTDLGTRYGFASAVNVSNGAAPNWTFAGNSRSAGSAIAIKETSSVSSFVKRHNGGIF